MTCSKHPWTLQRSDGTCPSCEMHSHVGDILAHEARTDDQRRQRRQMTVSARVEGEHNAERKKRSDRNAPLRARACELLRQGMTFAEVGSAIGRCPQWVSDTSKRHPDVARAARESLYMRRKAGISTGSVKVVVSKDAAE